MINLYGFYYCHVLNCIREKGSTGGRQVPLDGATLEADQGAALGAGGGHGGHHTTAGMRSSWNFLRCFD